jgi:hypothetical protein
MNQSRRQRWEAVRARGVVNYSRRWAIRGAAGGILATPLVAWAGHDLGVAGSRVAWVAVLVIACFGVGFSLIGLSGWYLAEWSERRRSGERHGGRA